MAQSFGVQPSRYTGGDRLDHPAFLQLQRGLVEAGFTWSTQGWSTSDAARDHWARGPRGTLARRLIEELSEPMPTERTARQRVGEESRWRRLRSRLELGRKE